jgi:hypothetical protein
VSTSLHRIAVSAFGVALGVACDTALAESVARALPPGASPVPDGAVTEWYHLERAGDADARFVLRRGAHLLGTRFRAAPLLDVLEDSLRSDLARRAPGHVFVHAGVVAWQGRAIVLPGRSGSGKTTLVQALLDCGAQYGSDDYAVLDAEGRVYPYARALSVRQGAHRRLRVAAADAGAGLAMPGGLPIGLVCATSYRAGAAWAPQPVSPGDIAMQLFAHTLAADERPALTLQALAAAGRQAQGLAGERGDAPSCADAILAAIGRTSPP